MNSQKFGSSVSGAAFSNREKAATTVLTIACRPIARIASPAASTSSSACRGSLPRRTSESSTRPSAISSSSQREAVKPSGSNTHWNALRIAIEPAITASSRQIADRLRQGRVERHAGHDGRDPGELARGEAGLGQVGAEHVGEPDQRREQQQQPGDEQHGLVRGRLAVLGRRLQAEREDHARGDGEDDQVDAERDLVAEPELLEHDAGGRAPPRRRRSAVHDAGAGEEVRARRGKLVHATVHYRRRTSMRPARVRTSQAGCG